MPMQFENSSTLPSFADRRHVSTYSPVVTGRIGAQLKPSTELTVEPKLWCSPIGASEKSSECRNPALSRTLKCFSNLLTSNVFQLKYHELSIELAFSKYF